MEYVSTNPLTMQTGAGSAATTLLSLGSLAIVKGKPFMLSEWNEYGSILSIPRRLCRWQHMPA